MNEVEAACVRPRSSEGTSKNSCSSTFQRYRENSKSTDCLFSLAALRPKHGDMPSYITDRFSMIPKTPQFSRSSSYTLLSPCSGSKGDPATSLTTTNYKYLHHPQLSLDLQTERNTHWWGSSEWANSKPLHKTCRFWSHFKMQLLVIIIISLKISPVIYIWSTNGNKDIQCSSHD